MPPPISQANQAWQQFLDQVRLSINRADFEAWVRDARPVAFDGQILSIGVANTYARDWLAEHLRATAEKHLRTTLNTPVQVVFVVTSPQTAAAPSNAPPSGTTVPQDSRLPATVDLQVVSLRLRDAFQQPHRIVFLPGYFLRWLPYLGTRAAWLYVALRQTYFLTTQRPYGPGQPISAGEAVEITRHALARWSHLTKRTINNILNQGLLAPLVRVDRDRHLEAHRQAPNRYVFTADMPLTPSDLESVLAFLEAHNLTSDPLGALAAALQQPTQALLASLLSPPPNPPTEPPSLRNALARRLRPLDLPQATLAKALGMAELLETSLIEGEGKLFIPWYFIEHHLPALGHTVAWLYLVARHRAAREGHPAAHGFRTLQATARRVAGWLGLKKPRYGRDLIPVANIDDPAPEATEPNAAPVAAFLRRPPGRGNTFTLAVQTLLPLTPADEKAYRLALRALATVIQQGDLSPLYRLQEAYRHGENSVAEESLRALAGETTSPQTCHRALEALAQLPKISPGSTSAAAPNSQIFPPEAPKNSSDVAKDFPPPGQNLPAEKAKNFPHVNLKNNPATPPEQRENPPAQVGEVPTQGWQWESLPAWQSLAPKVRKEIKDLPAWQGVAWLLYVTVHHGKLEAPLGFAVHKLRQGERAGGAFDILAQLPQRRLHEYLARHLTYGAGAVIAVEPLWRTMAPARRSALLELAGWLGVDFV